VVVTFEDYWGILMKIEENTMMNRIEEVYHESMKTSDVTEASLIQDLLYTVNTWNRLYCFLRSALRDEDLDHAESFLVLFSESGREVTVACSLVLHGCYKQAKTILRISLELLELSAYCTIEPQEYDRWLESNDYHLPPQLPEKIAAEIGEDYKKRLRSLYGRLSKVTHSTSSETEFNRMVECSDREFCPMIEMAFLSRSTDEMKEILECIQELFAIGMGFMLSLFPEVMYLQDSVLLEFFDIDTIQEIRCEAKKQGVEHAIRSESIDYYDCLKKRKEFQ
jgi:hypothetical protein